MTYILRLIVALCFLFPGYSAINVGSSLADSITRAQSEETIAPLAGRRPPGRPGGYKARGSQPKPYKARSYKPSTQKVAPGKSRPKQAAKQASKGKTYSKARRDAPGKSAKAKSSKAKSSKVGPKTYQKPKSAAPGKQRAQSAFKQAGKPPKAKNGYGSRKAKQIWTSTKSNTPVRNALSHWRSHKKEFPEYKSAKQYVRGTHKFIESPPKGTKVVRRNNGEMMYYHKKSGTFAAATASGVPKTMFRPKNPDRYWAKELKRWK